MHEKKQLARAFYAEDGSVKYSNVFYGVKGMPEAVKTGATKLHPDFKIVSAGYTKILSSQKEGYQVNLPKGTQKVELWLDAQGNELSKEYIAEAFKDLWSLDTQ